VWWWCSPVIPKLGKLRQEDLEFKASLNYILRSCLREYDRRGTVLCCNAR
jgi:hypothetical protein